MERAVVMRLTALGDVVLAEPVVRALKKAHAGVSIDFVTDRRYKPFVERFFAVDRVVGYDRRGEDRGWSGVRRVAERLGVHRYDAVFDLQGKLRTRALARRLNAAARFTLEKRSVGGALLSLVGHDPPITDRHSVDLYGGVLAHAEISLEGASRRPRLEGRPRPRHVPRRVGLAPGATHATKRWPVERFARLAERIEAEEIVLIGGPADRALLEALAAETTAVVSGDDATTMDVLGLVDLIDSLDRLVSVDTGPAHLAAALGVPTVVLFGPTSPVRWGPIGDPHRAMSLALPCAPCSNTGGAKCPRPDMDHACLRTLEVDDVLTAVHAVGSMV